MARQKKERGRPPRPMPGRIPDTPENVARALLSTTPEQLRAWEEREWRETEEREQQHGN